MSFGALGDWASGTKEEQCAICFYGKESVAAIKAKCTPPSDHKACLEKVMGKSYAKAMKKNRWLESLYGHEMHK
jgi:hypothetical protein